MQHLDTASEQAMLPIMSLAASTQAKSGASTQPSGALRNADLQNEKDTHGATEGQRYRCSEQGGWSEDSQL
ncbi:hypothetical protein WJX79_007667 [Trebouxia sp. C0005]